jgi:predicted PurR-regulated permease PerM
MTGTDHYTKRVLIAASIAALVVAGWWLNDVFIIIFGGIILAIALCAAAGRLQRVAPVPDQVALAVVVVVFVALLTLLFWLAGERVGTQFAELRTTLPKALDTATKWLDASAVGPTVRDLFETAKEGGVPWARLASFTTGAVGGVANAVLMIVLGLYLAASPGMYYRGTLQMVPKDARPSVDVALTAAGQGLERWLFGQMISMVAIGTLTAIGLSLLGMPLALSLGLIAGLLAFVPFFGPIASGLLAVVLAFTQGPQQALYVGLLCIAIQQIEGFVLMPVIQKWTVSLPPALGLLSVVVFGLLFGLPGAVFATPLMVVLMILVQKLYVDDAGIEGRPAKAPRKAST